MDGQDAAFIQGDEETTFTSELLGLKVHNLLRGLTHKLTVSLEGSVVMVFGWTLGATAIF